MSEERRTAWKAFGSALFWALIGGVIGNATAPITERFMHWLEQQRCQSEAALVRGKALRRQAIERQSAKLHADANAAFERAADCGRAEGQFFRAQAYCHPGWNAKFDPQRGWELMREAAAKDAKLAYMLADPDICPARVK
jgi:hypothetical protein